MVLKAHQVVGVRAQILAAQLHHRPRRLPGPRIAQAHRLHRPKARRVPPAPRQLLDRQAALEVLQLLPLLRLHALRRYQRIVEAVVLFLGHRAVDVVRRALVPPRRHVHPLAVDRIRLHNRRDRVVKRQVLLPGQPRNLARQRRRGQRPARHNGEPIKVIAFDLQPRHLFAHHRDPRLARNRLANPPRKLRAVHRQRMPRRHRALVRQPQQHRSRPPHLLLQQPRRRVLALRLQRVRAHQLPKIRRLVRRRLPHRPHLVQQHLRSPAPPPSTPPPAPPVRRQSLVSA